MSSISIGNISLTLVPYVSVPKPPNKIAAASSALNQPVTATTALDRAAAFLAGFVALLQLPFQRLWLEAAPNLLETALYPTVR